MSVALVSLVTPARRQLIVVFTDGSDSSSTTSPEVLTASPRRTRGTLAFVMPIAGCRFGLGRPDLQGRWAFDVQHRQDCG